MDYADILTYLTMGVEPICTIKEIADAMNLEPPTVYGHREGRSCPSFNHVQQLSHWLITERDCWVVYNSMRPPVRTRTNGDVSDELLFIHDNCTDVHRSFEQLALMEAVDSWNRIHDKMIQLKAEIDRKRLKQYA